MSSRLPRLSRAQRGKRSRGKAQRGEDTKRHMDVVSDEGSALLFQNQDTIRFPEALPPVLGIFPALCRLASSDDLLAAAMSVMSNFFTASPNPLPNP